MFDTLSDRLSSIFTSLRGKGRLSEEDITATLREIRIALLDADVALVAVKSFATKVRERALGADIHQALNPAQQVIKIVNDELVAILGGETRQLTFAKTPPTVVMLAGLQGTGKTTLAGKLGLWLKNNGHAPLLVACDLQRPNAVQQLQVVGGQAGVDVYAPEPGNGVGDPVSVARQSVEHARRMGHDIVVVDTAGRLGIDEDMMRQAAAIRDAINPNEILFVVDAMIGQDAVNTAQAFRDGVGFSGVVLTKLDGDARGGAALSVVEVTGQPILFASSGEKLADFDVFHPDRMVSRILGMGDVMTLIETAQRNFDADQAEEMAGKFASGEDFTLEDFLTQMQALRKMGPLANILGMLPGAAQMKDQIESIDERDLDRVAAIIHSMTPQERREPKILNASRRQRIARGSGVTVTDVNSMIDRFFAAQKMMKQMAASSGLPGMMMRRNNAKNAKKKGKKGGARVSGRPGQVLPPKQPSNPSALPPAAMPGLGGDSPFGGSALPKGLEGFDLSKLRLPAEVTDDAAAAPGRRVTWDELDALSSTHSPAECAELAREVLSAADEESRAVGVHLMSRAALNSPEFDEELDGAVIRAARDASAMVRAAAAHAAGESPTRRSLDVLVGLVRDSSAEVRAAVAGSLPMGDRDETAIARSVGALLLLIGDPDAAVRDMAAFGLGTQLSDVDTPRVRDALRRLLSEPDTEDAYPAAEAAMGLALRGDITVAPVIAEHLRDGVGKLWPEAAGALATRELVTPLRALRQPDDDESDSWVQTLDTAIAACESGTPSRPDR